MRHWFTCAIIGLLLLSGPTEAATYTVRVVRIIDGDTIVAINAANQQVRIRLADIDAPEHDQPYGYDAKQALATLVYARTVTIDDRGIDHYGRTVAVIYAPQNVNEEMVREGAAWVYGLFNRDPALPGIETLARDQRTGLWQLQDDQRIPPWQWRHRDR